MRAVVVGLVGGAILVALLWWLGFGEPSIDGTYETAAPGDALALGPEEGAATLEGRAQADAVVLTEAEATGSAVVRAQVVDVDGKPLGGIPVELRAVKRNDRFHWRPAAYVEDQLKPPQDLRLIETRPTQPDGWVEFRGLDVRKGYQVRAKPAPPRFGAQATVWAGRTTVPPVLVLDEGVALKLRVIDAEGRGTRAWITGTVLREPDHRGWNQLNTWQLVATPTGADGRLLLPAVPEEPLSLGVVVPGRGARHGIEVHPPFDEEVVLRFEHAGGPVFRGRVTDSAGQPVAGAKVLAALNPGGSSNWQSRYTRAAQAGADGTYRITGFPAGYLTAISVHAEGYIYVRSAAPPMDVADGQEVVIDVTLYRGGVLEGTVRDPDGNAIPGARVVAALPNQNYWNNRGTTAVADEAGRYHIENVPLGKGHVAAYADGFYMPVPEGIKVRNWQMPPGVLFEVKEEGQRLARDIELLRGVRVTGTVVDERDAPVVGARVWAGGNLQQRMQAFDQYATQRVTDAEGGFEYLGLAPGEVWRFSASTTEGRAKTVNVTLAEGTEPDPVRLVLKTQGMIRGTVDAGARRLTRPVAIKIRRKQSRGSYSTSTRADGAFEQRNLAAGSYEVHVSDGLGRRVGDAVTVEVEDGKVTDDVKLSVEPLGHVLGRVVDLDGEPVGSVQVRLHYKNAGGGNQSTNTNTRPDGRFAWRDLLDGDYEVQITGDKTRHPVRPGEEEQTYLHVAPPKDVVTGTVVGPDGQPVAGGYVSIRRMRGRGNWNGSGAQIVNGRFRGEAPPGDGQINVAVDNALDAFGRRLNTLPYVYEDWSVTSGPLEIVLEAGHKIAGQVLGPSGKPMPHVGIHIQTERRDGRKWYGYYRRNYNTSLRTDEEGRFEKLGLREGRYEVYARPGERWMQPEPVSAEAGSERVVIRITPGLSIQGRVVDEQGAGVAGVTLTYSWSVKDGNNRRRTMSRTAKSDAQGAFEVGGLPTDARGSLRANPPSSQDKSYIAQTVKGVAAGESGLVVTLDGGGFIEGKVVGPAGEPLSRMRVRASVNDGNRWRRRYSARSGSDGTFKLGPVPPGFYRLHVEARGSYSASQPIDISGPANDIVLEMPAGLPIKGKVLGEKLSGFYVIWYARNANGSWSGKSSKLQKDGSFFVNQGSEDPGRLLVRHAKDPRYAWLVDVRPSDGPLEIELVDGPCIRGHVAGLPETWRWANVYARNDEGVSLWGRVERDGTFVVYGVPEGVYRLSANMSPGRIEGKEGVKAGATDVELVYIR